jgi:transketolase
MYAAIAEARLEKNKPTIIRLRTTIGFGSKQQGTHGIHGSRSFISYYLVSNTKRMFGQLLRQTTFAR